MKFYIEGGVERAVNAVCCGEADGKAVSVLKRVINTNVGEVFAEAGYDCFVFRGDQLIRGQALRCFDIIICAIRSGAC